MKKRKMTYLVMAGALLAASCSSDKEAQEATGVVPISLGYTTEEVQTRANDNLNPTNITTGDAVKVLIKKSSETWGSSTAYATEGYNYTAGDAGALTPPTTAPAYPTDGTSVDMMAYYPADAATTFIVSNDQKDTDEGNVNYKASDLLVASPIVNQFRTSEKVNLQLYHKMAKVVIQLEDGDISLTDVTAVKLVNVKRQVTFTPTTGAISAAVSASGDNPDEIAISASGEGSAAVFPPQTINGTLVEVATTAGTAYYSAINKTFQAGHQYTATIKVNSSAIGLTNAITDWTVEATESGSTTDPQTLGELTEWINYYGTLETPQPEKYSTYLGWYVDNEGWIYKNSADVKSGNNIVGIVAYMSTTDVDTSIPGSRILVLSSADDATEIDWASTTNEASGASTDNTLMNGYSNTVVLNTKYGTTYPAGICWAKTAINNGSGWFLPSAAQWTGIMGVNGVGKGTNDRSKTGLYASNFYWSSTENASNKAYTLSTTGEINDHSKVDDGYVRACFAYPYNIVALNDVTSNNIGDIMFADGSLTSTAVTTSDIAAHGEPIGIVVYVYNESDAFADGATEKGVVPSLTPGGHGLVMCLKNALDDGTVKWRQTNVLYSEPQFSSVETASYPGYLRTKGMADACGESVSDISACEYPAAYAAFSYTALPAPTGTTGWFLPSMGQWNLVIKGLTTNPYTLDHVNTSLKNASLTAPYLMGQLNEKLSLAGEGNYTPFPTSELGVYWSSSESSLGDENRVWLFSDAITGIRLDHYGRTYECKVRPVLAF